MRRRHRALRLLSLLRIPADPVRRAMAARPGTVCTRGLGGAQPGRPRPRVRPVPPGAGAEPARAAPSLRRRLGGVRARPERRRHFVAEEGARDRSRSFAQAAALLGMVAYANSDLDLAIRSMEKAAALAPRDARIRPQLDQWRKESALHSGFERAAGRAFPGAVRRHRAAGARRPGRSRCSNRPYWSIGKTLNSYPGETLTVVLYTNKQFQDVTRAPAWAGGGFDGRIRLAVGGAMRTPAALDRVVRHELVHAVIQHAAPRNVPTWVNEGLASVLEGSGTRLGEPDAGARWRGLPARGPSDGFEHLDGREAMVAYAESAVAAQLLVERVGPNLGVFLQMVGRRPHGRPGARHGQRQAGAVLRRVAQARRHPLTPVPRQHPRTLQSARMPSAPPTAQRWLTAILILGASLRFFPIWFGLPYQYSRPDEAEAVGHALAMLGGDLNPHFFHWPSLTFYLFAAVFAVVSGIRRLLLDDPVADARCGSADTAADRRGRGHAHHHPGLPARAAGRGSARGAGRGILPGRCRPPRARLALCDDRRPDDAASSCCPWRAWSRRSTPAPKSRRRALRRSADSPWPACSAGSPRPPSTTRPRSSPRWWRRSCSCWRGRAVRRGPFGPGRR